MSNALRQENAPTGVNKDEGGQSTLGTQAVPWKDIHTVDLNVQRNVTIQGNLSVTGNTSTVEVQELHTEEPMIRVAKINTSDAVDIGIYGATSTEADGSAGASTEYHGFVRDADDKVWKLFEGNDAAESNGTITLAGGTEGTMQAKLNLPSAGDLKIAGTVVDSTAAELNKLNAVVDGTVAANKALIVDASKNLSGLNDVVLEGSLQAVAVTADLVGDVTGNSTTASALQAARNISVSGDAAGTVSFDGSADVDIALTISQDAVENSMIANPGFTMTDGSNSALRELGSTLTIQGTTSEVEVSHDTNGRFTVGLPSSVTVANQITAATFSGALVGNASSASVLETARNLTLDGDVSGTVSFDGSSSVTITTSLDAGNLLTVSDGTSSEEIVVGDTLTIQGTANETEVSYNTASNEFAVGLASTISGLSSVSSTSFTGDLTGKADTADTLETARTISLSGGVVGSVSFDGSADVDIAATIQTGFVENSMLANPGLSVSVDGGAVDVVNLGEALKFASGTDIDVTYDATTNEVAVALETEIASDTTGNAATASALEISRNISLSGDLGGSVSFDGSANADINATIRSSSVENSMLVNDGITIQDDNANAGSIDLGGSLRFSQTADETTVNFDSATGIVTIGLQDTVNADTTGNAATASALETSRILSMSGDVVGSVSFDGSADADIVATIQGGSVENSMLVNSSITFTDGTATDVTSLGESIKIQGTDNEVEVSLDAGTSTFSVGLPSSITADVVGNASTATALESSQNFSIGSGPVQATAVGFDGTGNVSLTTTIADGQITNDMLANDKLVISVDSVNYDRPLGSTLGFSATNLDLNYSAGTNEVQYGLPAIIGSDTTGNAATATALEIARTLSLSGDVTGSITFNGTADANIVSTIQPGAVENSMLQNSTLTILDDVTSGGTLSLGSSIKFSQTANETEVLYDSVTQTVTFGLPDNITADVTGNASTASALEIARTLSVSGDISGNASFDGSADSDLNVTVDSVDLSALQIASETQEVSTLVDADLFVIKDADGTNSKMSASVVKSYVRDDVLSAGTGVGFTSGVISIGQPVATSDNVTFNQITFGSNAVISETDAEKIDDITNGTALADKALVLDSSKSITGISTLEASSLTDGSASLTSGSMTGLISLTSGNITVSGDEVFSNNNLILNSGTGQVQIASGDKIVLQGNGGDIDISGDASFSRSVFYAVPSIKSSDYAIVDGDHILMFDLTSAGGNKIITLGNSGQTINTNRVLVVKNIGTANSLTFNSASLIDSATASSTVLAPGEKITLIGTPANGWQSI